MFCSVLFLFVLVLFFILLRRRCLFGRRYSIPTCFNFFNRLRHLLLQCLSADNFRRRHCDAVSLVVVLVFCFALFFFFRFLLVLCLSIALVNYSGMMVHYCFHGGTHDSVFCLGTDYCLRDGNACLFAHFDHAPLLVERKESWKFLAALLRKCILCADWYEMVLCQSFGVSSIYLLWEFFLNYRFWVH